MSNSVFVYRIDANDTLVGVSRNWCAFADANDWQGCCRPEDVVGHPLWEFIHDTHTQQIYREIFRHVRAGQRCGPIPFRCDSPTERRYLELRAEALPGGHIEITSTIVRTERRDPVRLLQSDTPRSTHFLTICSMCKKVRVSPREWAEIEEGLARLRLFEVTDLPQLTHGLCPSCFDAAIAELTERPASRPPRPGR